jgi:hypothetical protein
MIAPQGCRDREHDLQNGDWPDRPLRVVEADFRNDPRWLDFLSSHPNALIYHHPGWLAALEAEYGRKCVALACEGTDGEFLGILPLLPTRGLPLQVSRNRTGRRLSSLPRTPLAGPLASSDRVMEALLRAAMERAQALKNTQLEIKTAQPGLDRLVPELECVPWRDTYARGIPGNDVPARGAPGPQLRTQRPCASCETCRILSFGNARDNHQVRWAVNKAVKQGLSLRSAHDESELRNWYRLYLRVMRRNAVLPRPFRFFQKLWKELAADGHLELLLAERGSESDRSPAADADPAGSLQPSHPSCVDTAGGSILLQYGHTVFWAFTGSQERSSSLHATDLTLWKCIHAACKLGYDYFDLGEVAENHPELAQFKTKWGTVRYPMYRYYFPANGGPPRTSHSTESSRLIALAESAWRRLPLTLTAAVGDWIFSFL